MNGFFSDLYPRETYILPSCEFIPLPEFSATRWSVVSGIQVLNILVKHAISIFECPYRKRHLFTTILICFHHQTRGRCGMTFQFTCLDHWSPVDQWQACGGALPLLHHLITHINHNVWLKTTSISNHR